MASAEDVGQKGVGICKEHVRCPVDSDPQNSPYKKSTGTSIRNVWSTLGIIVDNSSTWGRTPAPAGAPCGSRTMPRTDNTSPWFSQSVDGSGTEHKFWHFRRTLGDWNCLLGGSVCIHERMKALFRNTRGTSKERFYFRTRSQKPNIIYRRACPVSAASRIVPPLI